MSCWPWPLPRSAQSSPVASSNQWTARTRLVLRRFGHLDQPVVDSIHAVSWIPYSLLTHIGDEDLFCNVMPASPMTPPAEFLATLRTSFCEYPPQPVPITGIAPGDECGSHYIDEDPCYGDATCNYLGVCELPDTEGQDCCDDSSDPSTCDDKRCSVGQFCNTETEMVGSCQRVTPIGEQCTMDRECGFKAFCHSEAADVNDIVCTQEGSLVNGESLGPANLPFRCASAQTVNVAE